jgi:hypothetical protein
MNQFTHCIAFSSRVDDRDRDGETVKLKMTSLNFSLDEHPSLPGPRRCDRHGLASYQNDSDTVV